MVDESLSPGRDIPVDTGDSARRRIVCGLSWGSLPGAGPEDLPEDVRKGVGSGQDLDLICLLFDRFGSFIDGVTGEEGYRTGDNGNIYHTGDVTGVGDVADDEQISLELFNLSSRVHQIFFIAEVQSGHSFKDITNPVIRLANPVDERDIVSADIGSGDGGDKNAYVFGFIHRRQGGGWAFRPIGDYLDGSQVSDWAGTLRRHLEIVDPDTGKAYEAVIPEQGETVKLRYTREARHRVICGLNWSANTERAGKMARMKNRGQNVETFDLDLACVVFNSKGIAIDGVSAKPDETVDSSGKIYHSGDHTTGEGDSLDDEMISVELRDLPDDIHHIVFLTEIQSMHTFGDISDPSIRFADAKTNRDQLTTSLHAPEGNDKNAYVFCRISRKPDGWSLTYINQYVNGSAVEDWIEYLGRYLG